MTWSVMGYMRRRNFIATISGAAAHGARAAVSVGFLLPHRPRAMKILCLHSPEEAGFVEGEKVTGVRAKSGL
jgi:hypothetical protein